MGTNSTVLLEQFTAQDRHDIEAQTQRILNHPLFQQSKRLPAFLRYIVNEALNHSGEGSAKERTLGIEVFGRKADYDNNLDPIVRVTASELRKKLAQYYYEDGHSDEIRIELKPGSYLPSFRRSQVDVIRAEAAAEPIGPDLGDDLDTIATPDHLQSMPQIPAASSDLVRRRSFWKWGAIGLLVAAVAATYLGFRAWQRAHSPVSEFWSELVQGSNHVLVVMPVIGSDDIPTQGYVPNVSAQPALSLEDTNLIVLITNQLDAHQAHYQLVSSSEVTLEDLRTGPAVLIGALDNIWTMRLTRDLPYVFTEASNNRTGSIVGTTTADRRSWTVNIDTPHTHINQDFGIVARLHDQLTGEPTVIIAGISSQGTQAAGELLTSREFDAIRSIAGTGGDFEVVIQTEAIDGHAGPPRIVAQKVW